MDLDKKCRDKLYVTQTFWLYAHAAEKVGMQIPTWKLITQRKTVKDLLSAYLTPLLLYINLRLLSQETTELPGTILTYSFRLI